MRERFVENNGGTAQTPAEPAAGSRKHIKTVSSGCTADHSVMWIAFDGPNTPQPKYSGASETFANKETWEFFSQFT
ncbi:hypothetical protein V8E51_012892 [Hyaloscypha variabilis]